MITIIIWLGTLLCPNPNHTLENHGNCNLIHVPTVSTNGDTGGENGGNPKPPPPPPPPVGP